MDCRLFEQLLQRDIDGLLDANERQTVQKHAACCTDCAALLADMTALDGLLQTHLAAVEPPPDFAAAVMAALPAPYAKPSPLVALTRRRWVRAGGLAAAAALLLTVGLSSLWPAASGPDPAVAPGPAQIAEIEPQPAPPPNLSVNPNPNPNANPNPGPVNPQPQPQPPPEQDPGEDAIVAEQDPAETGEDSPQQPEQEPRPVTPPQPASYTASVDLPTPAYETRAEGVLVLNLLAAYDDCDALLPSMNAEGRVEFYIKYKGAFQLWTQSLGSEEAPEYQEAVKYLPSLSDITGSVDESLVAGFPYVSALSPDGRTLAVSRGGDRYGVWLYDNQSFNSEEQTEEQGLEISGGLGGGAVLAWSSDGNKLLYTDATGKLFVYYLHIPQPFSLTLYTGSVSCAGWAGEGDTVVFAGKMDKSEKSSIYSIQIP